MRIKQYVLLACTCVAWSSIGFARVDRTRLTFQSAQYGNKTENLDILKTGAVGDITLATRQVYHVQVPEFIGISHDQVKAYLTTQLGQPLENRWQQICHDTLWPDGDQAAARKKLLDTKKYPEVFLTAVNSLGEDIQRVFKEHVFNFEADQGKFIEQAAHERLMVRSTGKEDTPELANAGGNETVANVRPIRDDVSAAMGVVVASYIGQKSFKQRLAVAKKEGHVEEILQSPFVPVLLQVMIGEQQDGQVFKTADDLAKIPVSGVMFTTEAEAKTPGLTHFQTTFGHNEGVVNSLVPVDTWYVGPHGVVYPVIRKKWQRLVPVHVGGLEKKDNVWAGGSFVEQSTLTYHDALAIKVLGDRIQAYYEFPMDVEFVYRPHEKTIYLVQARPIVFGLKEPNYVTDESLAAFASAATICCVKVGVGKAQVRRADSLEGILIDERLIDALNTYLAKSTAERERIACVIVKEMPAATSHEATTFRAENMPVLQGDDLEKIRSWLSSGKANVVVDVQRGLLINNVGGSPIATAAGWFESPMPRQISAVAMGDVFTGDTFANQVKAIRRLVTMKGALGDRMRVTLVQTLSLPTTRLLEEVKSWHGGADEQALRGLGFVGLILLYKLWHVLPGDAATRSFTTLLEKLSTKEHVAGGAVRLLDIPEGMEEEQQAAIAILDRALLCLHEIFEVAPQVVVVRDLRMLYPVHFLEALFHQERNDQVVAPYSLADIAGSLRQSMRALGRVSAARKAPVSKPELDLLKLADASFTAVTGQHWTAFVQQVLQGARGTGKEAKVVGGLTTRLVELGQLDVLPLWLNVSFEAAVKKHPGNMAKVTSELVHELDGSRPFFSALLQAKRALDSFDFTQFEEPEKFRKLWPDFVRSIIGYFVSESFLGTFRGGLVRSSLPQLAALNIMGKVVDTFDKSIKMMKGSTKYTKVEDKVANFKTMLDVYWDLFETWVELVPRGVFKAAANQGDMAEGEAAGSALRVPKYLERYRNFRKQTFKGEEQLQPSPQFSVTVAAIGSTSAMPGGPGGVVGGMHLEDYFTLTHQNLLLTVSSLIRLVIDFDVIEVHELIKALRSLFSKPIVFTPEPGEDQPIMDAVGPFNPFLLGISFENNVMSFIYNLPLRHHSAGFGLRYDKAAHKTFVEARFFCNNERPDIFKRIYGYAGLIDLFIGTKLFSRKIIQNEVYVCWEVDERTQLAALVPVIARMSAWMFGYQSVALTEDQWRSLLRSIEDLDDQHNLERALDTVFVFANSNRRPPDFQALVVRVLAKLTEQAEHGMFVEPSVRFVNLLAPKPDVLPTDQLRGLWQKVVPTMRAAIGRYSQQSFWQDMFNIGDPDIKREVNGLFDAFGDHVLEGIKADRPSLEKMEVFFNVSQNHMDIARPKVGECGREVVLRVDRWLVAHVVTPEELFRRVVNRWLGNADLPFAKELFPFVLRYAHDEFLRGSVLGVEFLNGIAGKISDVSVPADIAQMIFDVVAQHFHARRALELLDGLQNVLNGIGNRPELMEPGLRLRAQVLDDVRTLLDDPSTITSAYLYQVFNMINGSLWLNQVGMEQIGAERRRAIQAQACAVGSHFFDRIAAVVVPSGDVFGWLNNRIWILRDLINNCWQLHRDGRIGPEVIDTIWRKGLGCCNALLRSGADVLRTSSTLSQAIANTVGQLFDWRTLLDQSIPEVAPQVNDLRDGLTVLATQFIAWFDRSLRSMPVVDGSFLNQYQGCLNNQLIDYVQSAAIQDPVTRDQLWARWVRVHGLMLQKLNTYLTSGDGPDWQTTENMKWQLENMKTRIMSIPLPIPGKDDALRECERALQTRAQAQMVALEKGKAPEWVWKNIEQKLTEVEPLLPPGSVARVVLRKRAAIGLLNFIGTRTDPGVEQYLWKVQMMVNYAMDQMPSGGPAEAEGIRAHMAHEFVEVIPVVERMWVPWIKARATVSVPPFIMPPHWDMFFMPLQQAANRCREYSKEAWVSDLRVAVNHGFDVYWDVMSKVFDLVKHRFDGITPTTPQPEARMLFDQLRMNIEQFKMKIDQFGREDQREDRQRLLAVLLEQLPIVQGACIRMLTQFRLYGDPWILDSMINLQDGGNPETMAAVRSSNKAFMRRLTMLVVEGKVPPEDVGPLKALTDPRMDRVFDPEEKRVLQKTVDDSARIAEVVEHAVQDNKLVTLAEQARAAVAGDEVQRFLGLSLFTALQAKRKQLMKQFDDQIRAAVATLKEHGGTAGEIGRLEALVVGGE